MATPLLASLVCLVVGISDGDTLSARCPTSDHAHPFRQVKVRLAEIDAPESGQAFGQRSKQHLASLCYKVEATIRPATTDRYGRTVARVECAGKDANLEMVKAGMAWAYTRYQTDPAFPLAEQQARKTLAGLWSDPQAIPPWDFRRSPPQPKADSGGCITGPHGGRYRLTSDGQKRYGC